MSTLENAAKIVRADGHQPVTQSLPAAVAKFNARFGLTLLLPVEAGVMADIIKLTRSHGEPELAAELETTYANHWD